MSERTDLGERSDAAALTAATAIAGLALIDVGCGAGANARALAEAGATVLGVEPDPIQAAKNRDAAPTAGVTFVEARAEGSPSPRARSTGWCSSVRCITCRSRRWTPRWRRPRGR